MDTGPTVQPSDKFEPGYIDPRTFIPIAPAGEHPVSTSFPYPPMKNDLSFIASSLRGGLDHRDDAGFDRLRQFGPCIHDGGQIAGRFYRCRRANGRQRTLGQVANLFRDWWLRDVTDGLLMTSRTVRLAAGWRAC